MHTYIPSLFHVDNLVIKRDLNIVSFGHSRSTLLLHQVSTEERLVNPFFHPSLVTGNLYCSLINICSHGAQYSAISRDRKSPLSYEDS